jgi:hypothetical protein
MAAEVGRRWLDRHFVEGPELASPATSTDAVSSVREKVAQEAVMAGLHSAWQARS